jgi:hypothetical protein
MYNIICERRKHPRPPLRFVSGARELNEPQVP